jgi:ABC-2 type transport system ATP-binding protein
VSESVIEAQHLTKSYGSRNVLSDATLTIGKGVTGLLGANGAGKTTLLGMVMGLHAPDGGTLTVLGRDPRHAGAEIRARIGYAPEHHNLPTDLPAIDFVQHIAEIHGLPRTDAIGRASDALWYVGLGEERQRPLGTLSTGQRQRVKLAMAIAHDPALVLLDEPTDGLDPTQREAMLDLIRRLASDFGLDVLLSSHLLDEVERTCTDVVIIADGVVAAAGEIDALRGRGRGLTIEVDWGAEDLASHLAAHGVEVTVEASRLVVGINGQVNDHAALQHLVRDALVELNLPLRRLEDQIVSLEDVFLSVGK